MLNQIALLKHFFDTLWEYDPQTNQVYIYHDMILPDFCDQRIDYPFLYQMHLEQYVYWEDRALWEKYLSSKNLQKFVSEDKEEIRFCVRMKNAQNFLKWHEIYIEHCGKQILIGNHDMKEEKRNATITKAVLPGFDYVCRIDVHTGNYIVYYADHTNSSALQPESHDYEKAMTAFNQKYVSTSESSSLTENMKINNVVQKLNESEEYILYAEMKSDNASKISYKCLRFCYEDENKNFILLTRTDVSEIFCERKKREAVEQHYKELLTKMPIAISSTEVLVDENQTPYDFRYTYCNPAHEKLEGVQPGELTGKRFYEFFENSDPKWLKYYYETAFEGIPHIIRDYSPEIGKDLLLYTFCTEKGHCDCVIQDITQENFLLQQLYQHREEMMRILKTTTMAVFQYDPMTDEIHQINYSIDGTSKIYNIDELFQLFAKTGRIEPESIPLLNDCFYRVKKGEHSAYVTLRCTKHDSPNWVWFKLSLFDYEDNSSNERKVFGYIQDINTDMKRQEKLRRQAQKDALTGILNVGAGRSKIQKLLSSNDCSQKAMLMMDVDDFKNVNDTYGHIVGDKTLKRFAEILTNVFQKNAIVYRVGGDEFSVFLSHLNNAEKEVEQLIEKFHAEVQDAKTEFPFLSVSVGIYITDSCESYEQFYVAADKALYQSKRKKQQSYTVLNDAKKII